MKKTFLILALLSVSLSPLSSLAQVTGLPTTAGTGVPTASFTTFNSFLSLANTLINWFFIVILVFAVVAFLWAGFQYVFSFGSGDTEKAKNIILYAVVGVVVAVLAKSFVWIAYNVGLGTF